MTTQTAAVMERRRGKVLRKARGLNQVLVQVQVQVSVQAQVPVQVQMPALRPS
jgi:hypothetical protein